MFDAVNAQQLTVGMLTPHSRALIPYRIGIVLADIFLHRIGSYRLLGVSSVL